MLRKSITLALFFAGSVLVAGQERFQGVRERLKSVKERLRDRARPGAAYEPEALTVDVSNLTDDEIRQIVGQKVDLSRLTPEEKGLLVGQKIDLATVDMDILGKIVLDGKPIDLEGIEREDLVTILTAAPQNNRPPELTNGFWSFHSAKDGECHTLVLAPTPEAIKDDIYVQFYWSDRLPDHTDFKKGKAKLYVLETIPLSGMVALEYDAADANSWHGGGLAPNAHHNYLFKLKKGSKKATLPFSDANLIPGTLDNYKKYVRFIVATANPDLTYVFNKPGLEKNSYITDKDMDLLVAHGFVPPGERVQYAQAAAQEVGEVNVLIKEGLEKGYINEDDLDNLDELLVENASDFSRKLPEIASKLEIGANLVTMAENGNGENGNGNPDNGDADKPDNGDDDKPDNGDSGKSQWFSQLTKSLGSAVSSAATSGLNTIFKKSAEVIGDYFAKGVTFAMEGAIRWIFPSQDCPLGYARTDYVEADIKKYRMSSKGDTGDVGSIGKPKAPWDSQK